MFTHSNNFQAIQMNSVDTPTGRFYTTPTGDKYASITTILGDKEKPGLISWKQSLGDVAAKKEMNRAADRGTAVHLMIEKYLNNDPTPTTNQRLEHIVEFKSLKLILNNISDIIIQEAALYSDTLQVAGRVDCIGLYNGKLCIIDFKTSTNSKNRDIIQDYFLQTTAYAIMFEELYNIVIEDVIILMSVEKGVPLVFKGKVDDYIHPLIKRINTFYTNK